MKLWSLVTSVMRPRFLYSQNKQKLLNWAHTPDLLSRLPNGQANPPVSRAQGELRGHSQWNSDKKRTLLPHRVGGSAFQAHSLAGASLLSWPCFVPIIPYKASTPQETSLVRSEMDPCVWGHSSIKVSTFEVNFSLSMCVCKHSILYKRVNCVHTCLFFTVRQVFEEWIYWSIQSWQTSVIKYFSLAVYLRVCCSSIKTKKVFMLTSLQLQEYFKSSI